MHNYKFAAYTRKSRYFLNLINIPAETLKAAREIIKTEFGHNPVIKYVYVGMEK